METATVVESTAPCSALADHLIGLAGSQWALWRWVCVRGTGFPAQDVLKLQASSKLLRAADDLLEAERSVEIARNLAIEQVNSSLDDLRRNGQWEDKPRRTAMLKTREKLRNRAVPKPSPDLPKLSALEDLSAWLDKRETARSLFGQEFQAFSGEMSSVIRELAGAPRLREAVTWQNRSAVGSALDWLVNKSICDGQRPSRQRQNEELAASYLQRYCMKNDTIGFFGPVGWARWASEGEPLVVKPGPELLASRKVYLETWPIEALAAVIARNKSVYPSLVPLVMPYVRLEGLKLHHPIYGSMAITPGHAAILETCDGVLTAKQVAHKILRRPASPFRNELDLYQTLAGLAAKRVIFWGFNIPPGPHPEVNLRHALQRIDDEGLRQRYLGMLADLERARQRVEEAAGDAGRLNHEFENLESIFTGLTDTAATRAHGQTYGGRTVVYEDCRRDVEVNLGPEILHSLTAPISLLLSSARWLTSELTRNYRQIFTEIYAQLTRRTGSKTIDAGLFWTEAMPHLVGEKSPVITALEHEFRRKWERILNSSPQARRVEYSSQELEDVVRKEFPSRDAGWTGGRYHCPDVMIAAASPEAVQRGDYVLVLGEMHLGGNTLGASLFVNQHPTPEELIRAVEQDLGPRVIGVPPRRDQTLLGRTSQVLITPSDIFLEYALDSFATDRSRAVPVSAFVIEIADGELMARTRDGRFKVSAIDLVGGRFSDMVMNSFHLLSPQAHLPRISIDRLVIKRESWRFAPSQVEFAHEEDAATRFLRARSWANNHGIPRFVFCKVTVERKPSYLDFESPISVDIFSRMVRKTLDAKDPEAAVDITEMFPGADQLWLADRDGNRYTSELRMVAIDLSRRDCPPRDAQGTSSEKEGGYLISPAPPAIAATSKPSISANTDL